MPTRLAVGLEAKKSSSDSSDAPRVLLAAKLLVSPRCSIERNNFGNLICASLQKNAKKKQAISISDGGLVPICSLFRD